jgi:O-antigen/teichoic acid export membrane protein
MLNKIIFIKKIVSSKYVLNTAWLLGEKVLRLTLGILITVWLARYLKPELFGVFNYIQSFVGLFIVIGTLGLDGIVVRELIKQPDKLKEIMGTSFFLRLIGFLFLMLLLLITINFTSNTQEENILTLIFALSILFQSFNVIDFYFQSKVQSKFVVYSRLISFVASSLFKILLIYVKAPLIYFVIVLVLDSFLLSVFLIFQYYRNGLSIFKWTFNISLAKTLLSDSWPLILSGIVVAVYMKMDQVMIKYMLGSYEVGQYSAAARLSEAWYFIPLVISNSLFPAIINAKGKNMVLYKKRMMDLYGFLFWVSAFVAILTVIFGDFVISLLYGSQYSGTSEVLKIHIWTGVFVGLGVASSKWFIAENLQKYSFYRTLLGAIVNILLNLYLIPKYGIVGAAYATLAAQISASYLFNIFTSKTYPNFVMQTMALTAPYELYKFLKKNKKRI